MQRKISKTIFSWWSLGQDNLRNLPSRDIFGLVRLDRSKNAAELHEDYTVIFWKSLSVMFFLIISSQCFSQSSGGITPEQIYQPSLDWHSVTGSWEKLPEENPLAEKPTSVKVPSFRSLITLRKDGTCRIFNESYPAGVDGVWTSDDHRIFVTLPDKAKMDMYVYGVKGDFMITRTPVKNGLDQLWSRVK